MNRTIKKIESTSDLKKIMAAYYSSLAECDSSKKIAWCSSVGPAELLRAMGFEVFFPENHGAMIGASKKAADYISHANAAGYSPDICSYLTSDIGAFIKKETPMKKAAGLDKVPEPDVLVYCTNQCRDVQDWFSWYARHFDVPIAGVESFRGLGELTRDHVNAVSAQIKNLIPTLEKITHTRFDIDRLRKVVELSQRCSSLWKQVLETAASVPAPLTFFDAAIHMGPAVVLRGTSTACDYYELLLKELKQRVSDGTGAVEQEKYRLYWEGMPIWGAHRDLATLLSSHGAGVVASTYCNSWIFDSLDPQDPFDSMARAYAGLFIARTDSWKENYIAQQVEQFNINGIVFHEAKTCPNNSNSMYAMPKRIKTPSVVINGDLNDLRLFSLEQTQIRLEAFLERLD